MPWLTGTAYLHSVIMQEKKGMFKRWNFLLIIITFELCIFGTFLTRSGIVSSVHAFADSHLGPLFVLFLTSSTLFALFLLYFRKRETESEQKFQALFSREGAFFVTNLLFLAITLAVLWGTMFPAISEGLWGSKVTISAPFFNRTSWPLALAVLLLAGINTLIAWRKADLGSFAGQIALPLGVAVATAAVTVVAGVHVWVAVVFFSASAMVTTIILREFFRNAGLRAKLTGQGFGHAVLQMVLSNKRRYGGYLVHFGVAMALVGIIGSSFFSQEYDFKLKPGQSTTFGNYRAEFLRFASYNQTDKEVVYARLRLYQNGVPIGELQPEKHFHRKFEQPQTEVSIRSELTRDVYLVLMGWEQDQTVYFKALVNPVVSLLWLGGIIMALGTIFVFFPNSRPVSAVVPETLEGRSSSGAGDGRAAASVTTRSLTRQMEE